MILNLKYPYAEYSMIQKAGNLMPIARILQFRRFLGAPFRAVGAAARQGTADLVADGAGNFTLEHNALLLFEGRFRRNGGQQCLGQNPGNRSLLCK